VKDFLTKTFKSKKQVEWELIFNDIDCCWSTIRTLHEALTEEEAPIIKSNDKSHIKNPIRFTDEPAQLSFELPAFGEHTNQLKEDF